jgi:hypothetical protein
MIQVSPEVAKEAEAHGFCVLATGEQVAVRGENFTVFKFDKRGVTLEKKQELSDFIVGERVSIKGGSFKVLSLGAKFVVFKGLPGNEVIDNALLDKIKKMKIKSLRKQTINKEQGKE